MQNLLADRMEALSASENHSLSHNTFFFSFEKNEFNSTGISMWVSGKSRYVFFVDIIQTQCSTAFQNIQNYCKRCSELGERANQILCFFACKKTKKNGELARTPLRIMGVLYKGFLNLGCYMMDFQRIIQKKQIGNFDL